MEQDTQFKSIYEWTENVTLSVNFTIHEQIKNKHH